MRKEPKLTPSDIIEALQHPTISPDRLHQIGVMPLSRGSIYAACNAGEIECIRVGRKIVIPTAPLRKKLGLSA